MDNRTIHLSFGECKVFVNSQCKVYVNVVKRERKKIATGTPFEELPEDFECPVCGLGKDAFEKEE